LTHVIRIPDADFDLEKTLNCGQVFHWEKVESGFIGAIGERALYIEQRLGFLHLRDGGAPSPPHGARELTKTIARYFALDHPLAEICDSFPKDPIMNAARGSCVGLRIIRQPKWECLATFICSSMKQVAHICQISLALRKRFGEPRSIGNRCVYSFPTAQRVAQASEKKLRECKLGYRAKSLRATARLVSSGKVDLETWSGLPDTELRKQLCALPGVGPKIANCVMLFAYERLRAFPIDVWIERVLRHNYFFGRKKISTHRLREFAETYFGKHGGYAQQYLFHHARMSSKSKPTASKSQCRRRAETAVAELDATDRLSARMA
jgi:N-glycosylase/DNA lyase